MWRHHSWWNRLFPKIRFLIKEEIHMLVCFTSLVADITFTTYRLFNVPSRKWWQQQKSQNLFRIYKCYKTYIQKLLCAKFPSNWTNIKQNRKNVPMAPPNPSYLTSKKTNFCGVPMLTSSKLSWMNHKYYIFKIILI